MSEIEFTVGEKWHRDQRAYCEELTVEGLASDNEIAIRGTTILAEPNEDVQVRFINNVTSSLFTLSLPAAKIQERWERGEAPVDMSESPL